MIKTVRPDGDNVVQVTFMLPEDESAGAVSVVGDFNDWDPYAHPLQLRGKGSRSAVVSVPAGRALHFRYLAEGGLWFDDDTADERDPHGAVLTV